MNHRLLIEAQTVRMQLDTLLVRYPELSDDAWLLADSLEGQTDLFEVLAKLVREARDAASFADAIQAQERMLAERRNRFERREEACRALMLELMQAAQQTKLTLPEATISLSALPPRPIVDDEAQIPDALCRFRRAPDLASIKAAMLAGEEVPGVHMSNGGTTLTIRTK